MIVHGDLAGQAVQLRRRSAAAGSGSPAFSHLPDILIGRAAGVVVVRSSMPVLTRQLRGTGPVLLLPLTTKICARPAHGDRGGVPAGRDQARPRASRGAGSSASVGPRRPGRAHPVETTATAFSPPLVTSSVAAVGGEGEARWSRRRPGPCAPIPAGRWWRWSRRLDRVAVSITSDARRCCRGPRRAVPRRVQRRARSADHRWRCALHARRHEGRDGQGDDLAVALAGDIGLRVAWPRPPRAGSVPPGWPALARIDHAGPQVLFGHRAGGQIDQADRVVLKIGDQQTAAVGADRQARRLRLAPPGRRRPCGRARNVRPGAHRARRADEFQHVVVDAAGHEEAIARRAPRRGRERCWARSAPAA